MLNVYKRAEVSFKFKNEIGQSGKNSKAFIAHDLHLDADIVVKQLDKNAMSYG